MADSLLIPVGKISRTHGVRGAVKIYPYGESLAERRVDDTLYLAHLERGGREAKLTFAGLRPHGKVWIAEFREIGTREEAEELIGQEVFLPEDSLSPTSSDEYYYYQLLGLRVETVQGEFLGQLVSIIETGSNDVYVVDHRGKEALIPALEHVIVEVDLKRRLMIVDPPEGLIDDL